MGFLKHRRQGAENGGVPVHWHRADLDGAPFRGDQVPMLREEEFDEFKELVADAKCGLFDTSQPDQKIHGRTYQQVLDGILSTWFKLLYREHQWSKEGDGPPKMFVYIEWAEVFTEFDKDRLLSIQGGMTGGSSRSDSHDGPEGTAEDGRAAGPRFL